MSATFGREMKAKEFLEKNNVRCFVPLRYQLVKGRSKDKVRKLVPAISNLVFVNATKDNIKILKTKLPYLQYHTCPDGGKNIPITVPCAQMEQFIAACNTYNEKMAFVRPGNQTHGRNEDKDCRWSLRWNRGNVHPYRQRQTEACRH